MKEYAEICNGFKHFYGMAIDEGKYCLACQHYWQTNEKIWGSWKCEITKQATRMKAFFESQQKEQLKLTV